MATYTQNYTLHQWEDSDDFLRSDFNEDFAKIDTALGAIAASATTAQRATESNAYNIYNLILQNYYESKYTGYKSALLFDGFMDSSNIATLGDGLYVNTTDGQVEMDNVGQQTVTNANFGNTRAVSYYDPSYSIIYSLTTTSYGTLSQFQLYAIGTITCTSYFIDSTGSSVAVTSAVSSTKSTVSEPHTFTINRAVQPGESYRIYISYPTSGTIFYGSSASTESIPGGKFIFEPSPTAQGTIALPTADLGDYSRVMAWANCSAGSVSFSVNSQELTQTAQQTSTTLDGITCTESAHLLDLVGEGETTISITMTAPDSSQMYLYDYGMVFL